jgi:PAS domain S-box-containing protein
VRRVRNALDTTRDGVYLFDPDDLHFSHVNSGAALQTGYTRAQLCTMTPMHLLPDYDDRSTRGIVRSLREGAERAVEITTWLRRADGDDVPIEMLLQFTPATRDDPAVCTAVVRDVTERVRAQQQLLEAERQLALLDDRERIGRDLHDRVIQRLFSAGLGLQSIAAAVDDEAIATRLERAIDEVDNSIRDLRTVIFGLSRRSRGGGASLKQAVLELATESARALSFEPRVRFDGPVDTMVPAAMSEHVMAALREILANVAKHAGATHVDVELAVGDMFVLRVRDDGIGLPDPLPRHGDGLRNLQQRAASLGGTFHAVPAEPTGTIVEWEVPLVAGDAGGADPGPTALPDLGARN